MFRVLFMDYQTKAVVRYKGHQNTSKNFVRANFGPNEEYVIGGSEVCSFTAMLLLVFPRPHACDVLLVLAQRKRHILMLVAGRGRVYLGYKHGGAPQHAPRTQ